MDFINKNQSDVVAPDDVDSGVADIVQAPCIEPGLGSTTSTPGMHVRVVSEVGDLESIGGAWDMLWQQHGLHAPDAERRRFLAECGTGGGQTRPYVVVFLEGSSPRAIIVAKRRDKRIRCQLGPLRVSTPRLDCVKVVYGGLIHDGSSASRAAIGRFFDQQLAQRHVDHIGISHLPSGDSLWADLRSDGLSRRAPLVHPAVHWRRTLLDPQTTEPVIHHSRKTRYKLRRLDRMLTDHYKEVVSLECYTQPQQVQQFMERACSVAAQSYQHALGIGVQDTPMWHAVMRACALSGGLRSYVLATGNKPIAYAFGNVCGDTYTLEATAFVPVDPTLSPGTVLLCRMFDDLVVDRVAMFDFGLGDGEYKSNLGDHSWSETTLHFYGSSWRARVSRAMYAATLAVSHGLHRSIGSTAMLKRARKLWRKRLRSKP